MSPGTRARSRWSAARTASSSASRQSTAMLRRFADLADWAVPAVADAWDGDWSRRVVVVVPRSVESMAGLLGSPASSSPGHRRGHHRGDGRPGTRPRGPDHRQPPTRTGCSAASASRSCSPTRRPTSPPAPTPPRPPRCGSPRATPTGSGYRDTGRTAAQAAPNWPRRSPGADARAAADGRGLRLHRRGGGTGPAYEGGWLACRMIAEQWGEDRLDAFYRAPWAPTTSAPARSRGRPAKVLGTTYRTRVHGPAGRTTCGPVRLSPRDGAGASWRPGQERPRAWFGRAVWGLRAGRGACTVVVPCRVRGSRRVGLGRGAGAFVACPEGGSARGRGLGQPGGALWAGRGRVCAPPYCVALGGRPEAQSTVSAIRRSGRAGGGVRGRLGLGPGSRGCRAGPGRRAARAAPQGVGAQEEVAVAGKPLRTNRRVMPRGYSRRRPRTGAGTPSGVGEVAAGARPTGARIRPRPEAAAEPRREPHQPHRGTAG